MIYLNFDILLELISHQYDILLKKGATHMRKKQLLNQFLVLLFPIIMLIVFPMIIHYTSIYFARTYNLTVYLFISIGWILIGIVMALMSYRLTNYSDKTDKFTKWILAMWTFILIFLLAGLYFGYSHIFYITFNLYGTFFVELTTGFYLSLMVLLHIKR